MNFKTIRTATVFLFILFFFSIATAKSTERVSSFREYNGYSQPVYDGWVRSSVYIPTRDGTRLAADIFRPSINGKVTDEKLPVIWTHTRYHRAFYLRGNLRTIITAFSWLETMLRHGYVVVAVDVRGSGASFGVYEGPFSQKETQDAYDVTEWLAQQDWSSGKIGMFGLSYLGITQYMAASTKPPHLKAIIPEKAMFDAYSFSYPNGIFRRDFVFAWSNLVKGLPLIAPALPVDEDKDETLYKTAQKERVNNRDVFRLGKAMPYRNSVDSVTKERLNITQSPSAFIKEINESGVAVYTIGGWYDLWAKDALLWFANLKTPQRLMIGPWFHQMAMDEYHPAERLRWFDYWLKGIDNGITKEPRIWYYTINATTTEKLSEDMEVTGNPVANLWISSSAQDVDFFVYLEDVDEKGVSHYVTEGVIRASHRKLSEAPFNNLGLPYHRSFTGDVLKLNGSAVELVFDLHPTSYIFKTGHHIRITVTCADKDNAQTLEQNPAPTVKVYRDVVKASYVELPLVK